MDHQHVSHLRETSAAWRLLRADNAALVLSFLGPYFVDANQPAVAAATLAGRLDDCLDSLRDADGERSYPRPARDYLDTWAAPEQGWLRKFYPAGAEEPHYDATPALAKAYGWVSGLQARSFVGTESRLHTLVDLLRQMVQGAETDPEQRLAALRRRRAELDAEIAEVDGGLVRTLGGAGLRDRYQLFASTARDLLADFREVEENFRSLDRAARERIAGWQGSKGGLLDDLVGDRTSIADSDQGRSFQAFYDFLLSRTRQDELADLLDRVHDLDEIVQDARLRHVDHDWLDAAERTQQTVRLLSEQLRRFLDDRVWLENRRVTELLRSIEARALVLRSDPRPPVTMSLAGWTPDIRLPVERPLYRVRPESAVDSDVVLDLEPTDTEALFEQTWVDHVRLAANARRSVRRDGQVSLSDLLDQHPVTQGIAEIVAYLSLTEDDLEVVVDDDSEVRIGYLDCEGHERTVRMPRVTIARRTARRAVRGGRGA